MRAGHTSVAEPDRLNVLGKHLQPLSNLAAASPDLGSVPQCRCGHSGGRPPSGPVHQHVVLVVAERVSAIAASQPWRCPCFCESTPSAGAGRDQIAFKVFEHLVQLSHDLEIEVVRHGDPVNLLPGVAGQFFGGLPAGELVDVDHMGGGLNDDGTQVMWVSGGEHIQCNSISGQTSISLGSLTMEMCCKSDSTSARR